jgi:hypothetical protein
MRSIAHVRRSLLANIVVAFAVLCCLAGCAQAVPGPAPAQTPPPWASLPPDKRNQAAQAYYNEQQADALRRKLDRSWLERIVEDQALGYGALAGGLLAIVSLYVNVRMGRRQERTTQTYEAVKRLGDDSAAVRSSAAGLVYVLARPRGITALRGRFPTDYYLGVNQLVTALAIESDLNVIVSIHYALRLLTAFDPAFVEDRLQLSTFESGLVEDVGTCTADETPPVVNDVMDGIAEILGWERSALDSFVRGHQARYVSAVSQYVAESPKARITMRQRSYAGIRSAGSRLRAVRSLRLEAKKCLS